MRYAVVIARAFRGEPLVRKLIHRKGKVAYLASPDRMEAVEAGDSIPIGFPIEDIFIYNQYTYEIIRTEWDQDGVVSRELWNDLAAYCAR